LSFYFFWYTFGFGLSAIHIGITLLSEDAIRFSVADVPARDVASGYVIYLIGSLSLHVGMQLNRPRRLRRNTILQATGRTNYLILLGVSWTIGIIAKLKPSWFSAFGALGNPLQWLAIASLSTLALTPIAKLRLSGPIFSGLLIVGVAGLAFASLETNSKAAIMFSFFPIIWLFLMDRSLRKWLPPLFIALAVLYFAVVAPLIMTSRKEQLLEGESLSDRAIRTFQSHNFNAEQKPDTEEEGPIDAFLSRQFDPIPVGFLIGEVREYGLQMGDTMDYITYAFVPRIIWPDKPNVTRGAWFTAYLGFSSSEEESTTSTGITATGELYWNFGVVGVVAGMCFLGIGISGLWRMAGTDPRNQPAHMVLYCMIMLTMPDMPEAVTVFVSIVINFLIFQTLFILIGKSGRKQGRNRIAVTTTIASR
jgi:hypothetical protein